MTQHNELKDMIIKACPFIRQEALHFSECGTSALFAEYPETVCFSNVGGRLYIDHMGVFGWEEITPKGLADLLEVGQWFEGLEG